MRTSFTVDITGTSGMRTGEWADGEEYLILPDTRHRQADAAARVRLRDPDAPPAPAADGAPRAAEGTPVADRRAEGAAARERTAGGSVTVAEVEERAERQRQVPHPVLEVRGPDGAALCTVRPERPGVPDPESFRVTDDRDEPLCRIVRRPARIGRRASWHIVPADGSAPVVGYRGTWPGWIGFVVMLPVWVLFFLASLLVTAFTLGEVTELLVWGAPKRVVWRRRWAPPLFGDALDFRYMRAGYRWDPDLLDARLAYAQAGLHYFTRMHRD